MRMVLQPVPPLVFMPVRQGIARSDGSLDCAFAAVLLWFCAAGLLVGRSYVNCDFRLLRS